MLSVLKKREQIAYKTIKGGGIREIFSLFHIENFVFCLVVACPVEITGMTLSFWIPTLLNKYAGYTEKQASVLHTLISVCRALAPFTTLWVLHRLFGGKEPLDARHLCDNAAAVLRHARLPAGIPFYSIEEVKTAPAGASFAASAASVQRGFGTKCCRFCPKMCPCSP